MTPPPLFQNSNDGRFAAPTRFSKAGLASAIRRRGFFDVPPSAFLVVIYIRDSFLFLPPIFSTTFLRDCHSQIFLCPSTEQPPRNLPGTIQISPRRQARDVSRHSEKKSRINVRLLQGQ